MLAESEGDLQRVVNEFYCVCKRRKLKVNAGKSKVMVFERGLFLEDGGEGKNLIDYIAVDERLRKDVLGAEVVRGVLEVSDHYAVVVKIMLIKKWEFYRKNGKEKRSIVFGNEGWEWKRLARSIGGS